MSSCIPYKFKDWVDETKLDWKTASYRIEEMITYDYKAMRESHKELKQELIQVALHPTRISNWLDAGMDLEDL